MIISFQVANFRSLRDSALLSMEATADTDQPGGIEVVRQVEGLPAGNHGVLPVAVLYGANAAGKSNAVKALELLIHLVVLPVRFQKEDGFLRMSNPKGNLQPFRLDAESRDAPVEFEIVFLCKGIRYAYTLHADTQKIHAESLSAWPEGREALLFARGDLVPDDKPIWRKSEKQVDGLSKTVWIEEVQRTESTDEPWYWGPLFAGKETEGKALAGRTRLDMPYLSACAIWDHAQAQTVLDHFFFRVTIFDAAEESTFFAVGRGTRSCTDDAAYSAHVLKFLKAADTGIQDLEIETTERPGKNDAGELTIKKSHQLWTVHAGHDGKPVRFDMNKDESHGTARLFGMTPFILRCLEYGGVFVADELHAGLHPLLLRCLVRLFQSPKTNPQGAQLIFATHDVTLLDSSLLRRDQIYLVEKGKDGASTLYSLSDFKDKPRKEVPLMKHYLAGRFAAVPHLAEEEVWAGFSKAFADDREGA